MLRFTVGIFFLAVSVSGYGQIQLQYANKKVPFSSATCRTTVDGGGERHLRIEVGYDQFENEERVEIVLPQPERILQSAKGTIAVANPETDGQICLRSFLEERATPQLRTFCVGRLKGDDSCELNYENAQGKLTVSVKCHELRRAQFPKNGEKLSFEIPASQPIQCQIN